MPLSKNWLSRTYACCNLYVHQIFGTFMYVDTNSSVRSWQILYVNYVLQYVNGNAVQILDKVGKELRCLNTKGGDGEITDTKIKWSIISKSVMIIIFVEIIDQLIDYLINCASLSDLDYVNVQRKQPLPTSNLQIRRGIQITSPSDDSLMTVVSLWQKYVHKVMVNRLENVQGNGWAD